MKLRVRGDVALRIPGLVERRRHSFQVQIDIPVNEKSYVPGAGALRREITRRRAAELALRVIASEDLKPAGLPAIA